MGHEALHASEHTDGTDPFTQPIPLPSTTPAQGQIAWDSDANTLAVGKGGGVVLQVGEEMHLANSPVNDEAVQVNNGEAVYLSGVNVSGDPLVKLANASDLTARSTIAIATKDVPAGAAGEYTTFGVVRDFDTTFGSAGDPVFLDTTAGQLTTTRPEYPNYTIRIGTILVSDVSAGALLVHIDVSKGNDLANFYAGSFREPLDALVTSDGATITLSLEQKGTGDLTMQFSSGDAVLDTTPAATIALTAGTATSPQANYIYVPESTKVLTKSTTGWPATEHIKVTYVVVQDAVTVQTDGGALINQNWNDELQGSDGMGHMLHMAERIRRMGAGWFSGIAGEGTDDYTTSSAGSVTVQTGAGVVYQMHAQSIPAKDTSVSDTIKVVNHDTTPYLETQNLYDVVDDAQGATLDNKYFNIVLAGVANKGSTYAPLLALLPNGSYSNLSDAQGDVDGYDVLALPREFNKESSTGFLIARLTFRKTGGTWVYQSTVDLRGFTGSTATGGGIGGSETEFSDSQFRVFNNTESTKKVAFDVSGVTAGNTRTLTVPDKDVDLDSLPRTLEINNTPTGAYTLVAGDNGKLVTIDAGLTIPTGLAIGFQCSVYLNNAAAQTLTTTGLTVKGNDVATNISADGIIAITVIATNTVLIAGEMEA